MGQLPRGSATLARGLFPFEDEPLSGRSAGRPTEPSFSQGQMSVARNNALVARAESPRSYKPSRPGGREGKSPALPFLITSVSWLMVVTAQVVCQSGNARWRGRVRIPGGFGTCCRGYRATLSSSFLLKFLFFLLIISFLLLTV